MKTWFTYSINGLRVATWANNIDEAEANLRREYPNDPMTFTGLYSRADGGTRDNVVPDRFSRVGMTVLDMAAAGLQGLRR